MDSTKEFVHFQNHILNDDLPIFKVFKDDKGNLVAVSLFRDEDKQELNLEIQVNTIVPRKFEYVGEFECDGHSDFNWGMIEIILDTLKSKRSSKLYRKAKKLSRGI